MSYQTNGTNREVEDGGAEDPSNELDALPTDEFLKVLGARVRQQRSTKNMSRKRLAEVSGVSERYLAQLESGQGNMSIALLRKVTSSIGMPLCLLFSERVSEPKKNGLNDYSSESHLGVNHDRGLHGLPLASLAATSNG